jgi:nucleoside-diphosphate-sugar epimerase
MSDRLRLDLVVNDFVASAVAAKKITILSDGTPWRPLIHVRDMARAIDWSIGRKPEAGGNFLVVNTGSDSWNYQVKNLAEAVAEIIPGVEVSINKAAPQVDLPATIRELKLGLEDMNFHDADFRKSNLMRLNTLSTLRKNNLLTENLIWAQPS